MLAVELVEVAVIRRVMLRPIPPIPVTALGDQDLVKRQLALRLSGPSRILRIELARVIEVIPCTIILRRADPYIKVRVDPRSWHQRIEPAEILMAGDGLGDRQRFDTGVAQQFIIESTQKLASRPGIVFPGILSIENDRDHRIAAVIEHWP